MFRHSGAEERLAKKTEKEVSEKQHENQEPMDMEVKQTQCLKKDGIMNCVKYY